MYVSVPTGMCNHFKLMSKNNMLPPKIYKIKAPGHIQ